MSELDRLLDSAKHEIAWPDHGSIDQQVMRRLTPTAQARRRLIPTLAAGLAVAVLLAIAIPSSRESLSAWLGIGGIDLQVGVGGVGATLELGDVVTDVADLSLPGGLASYTQAFRDGQNRTWFVYLPATDLPRLAEVEIAGLLGVFDGSVGPLIGKTVGDPASQIRVVSLFGSDAYWIEGAPHSIQLLDNGDVVEATGRVSGNALIWESNGLTFRFETGQSLEQAIQFVTE